MICMRMKEVCEKTGLTDRAVRLYIDSGLLNPRRENNYTGRTSIHFDEADIDTLQMVSVLRKACFSIADIKKMLEKPEEIPAVIRNHCSVLEEDIFQKQAVLKSLSSFSDSSFESCFALAKAIGKSSPELSEPKEDIYMYFEEFKKMIRRRLTSILAFGALIIGALVLLVLGIKTAFLDINILQGGGFKTNYALLFDGFKSALALTPSVFAALASIFVIPRLVGGKRKWLFLSLGFCVLSVAALLLLPEDVSKQMFFHEFLAYRYSFMHEIFYATNSIMDCFIASLKFIPNLIGAILIVIGLFREKELY